MGTDKKDIKELWLRYVEERATPDELNELFALLQDMERDAEHTTWAQQAVMSDGFALPPDPQQEEAIWQQLLLQADGLRKSLVTRPVRRIPFHRRWWAAASVLLVLGIGAYFWFQQIRPQTLTSTYNQLPTDILPGKEGAILTLSDGRQVVLDSLGDGMIAMQNGAEVVLMDGQLTYNLTGESAGEVVYNTMTTPKGRQFNLLLPDGTRVWLNAASSIRYPTVFAGAARQVEVTGEACFEVAKNEKIPFLVNANNKATIEVLGTYFNVNAYENETAIYTTLLEGSVRVQVDQKDMLVGQQTQPGKGVVLKPGQQAQITDAIRVVNDADIDKVMAWKNGLFNFEGASLNEVMRQLERWYNIEVVYEKGEVEKGEFVGKMTRGITLNQLLVSLEELGVNCRLEGRRLTVLP